jgi:hypothetical protein
LCNVTTFGTAPGGQTLIIDTFGYFYTCIGSNIIRIIPSGTSYTTFASNLPSSPECLTLDNSGNLYCSIYSVTPYIYKFATTNLTFTNVSSSTLKSYANNLFIYDASGNIVNTNPIIVYYITTDTPCFLEGTQILTDKGYRPIQELRKGDLVKTLLDGFVPIHMIGKKDIEHPASQERIKHQLYVCSTAQYPEITEDLVLTGCHSILVDNFTDDEQREQTRELLEDIYITDNKYRLPACIDGRTEVYENPGTYTIYHLALINNDCYMNYGIYANGLLVETCSKRYLKECSGMDLL